MIAGKPGRAGSSFGSQAGLGLAELLIAAVLAAVLVLSAGFLFNTQVRGYRDLKNQVKIQAGIKKAIQVMVREAANTGGFMEDPRKGLETGPNRLQLAYVDLQGKYCAMQDTVTLAFYVKRGKQEDTLFQDIQCNLGSFKRRGMSHSPADLDLSFQYFDKHGAATWDALKVSALELRLSVNSKQAAGTFVKKRVETVRVQCVNL